jgi:hypothetical protein
MIVKQKEIDIISQTNNDKKKKNKLLFFLVGIISGMIFLYLLYFIFNSTKVD